MRIRVHYFNLYSSLVKNKEKFVLISDIHSDINKLEKVYEVIEDIQPSFITIPGDVIDYVNDFRNEKLRQILEYEGGRFKTFISIGNHDIVNYLSVGNRIKDISIDDFSFFNNLDKSNITVFNSTFKGVSLDNNINIYGMELLSEWYRNNESEELFIKRLNSYFFDSDKFNILLFHSPYRFLDKCGKLIDFDQLPDLIVSGHTHGGLTPYILQNIMPNNRGLIGTGRRFLPINCYGIYNNFNSSLIISDGVTKIHDSFGGKIIAPIADKIYIPDVYVITIVPNVNLKRTESCLVKTMTNIIKK